MKKISSILIIFLAIFVSTIAAKNFVIKDESRICSGSGYDVVYTIRGERICAGSGYDVVYTIRE